MGKLIMLSFFSVGSVLSYYTYEGTGQEKIETIKKERIKKEASVRSNSYRASGRSYNSSSYSYGK
jgi:hypothetical protein